MRVGEAACSGGCARVMLAQVGRGEAAGVEVGWRKGSRQAGSSVCKKSATAGSENMKVLVAGSGEPESLVSPGASPSAWYSHLWCGGE